VLLLVEAMFPKETLNGVSNVRSLAVETLEQVRAGIAFLGFSPG